ncbi:hypothetical protein PG994_002611 [Apiospora phragmitis]|uniref:Uncharacterized protein n=1 Tax=Apiospora phragmitis TaxID=2905665 RepID=A0ABR1W5N5_9PEZI
MCRIGDYLNFRDLTSMQRCCRNTFAGISGRYYIKREVEDGQDFDISRAWHIAHQAQRKHIIDLVLGDVERWPESRATKFDIDDDEFAQRVLAMMDEDVEK